MSGIECTGVILAGGQATRYGGAPKGLERVGGERIIDRVATALTGAADRLLVISNDPAAAEWLAGAAYASDVRPGLGSLGGIHAALARAGTPVLVVAWDMPFVTAQLLRTIRESGEGADAAVPESSSKRGLEPLCAYYGTSCLEPIERRLDSGDRRVIAFYDDIDLVRIDRARIARHGDPELLFMNVNSPDELTRAEAHSAKAAAHGDHCGKEA
ncbi:MAG: molybdenum cofactor guanylyltransferase [Gemmatimonadaceae bacterium]